MIQNQLLEIALYPGCIQGVFLSYVLWNQKSTNRPAVLYFTILLLTVSALMLFRASFQPEFVKKFSEVILLPDAILFLTGPLIYLFSRSLLRLDPSNTPLRWLHFIPAFFHIFFVNTWLGLHLNRTLYFLSDAQIIAAFYVIEGAAIMSMSIYLACSLQVYYRYQSAFYQKYASPFVGQFLQRFILICFVLTVFWLASFLSNLLNHQSNYVIYTLFWVLVVAAIYFVAYKLWTTPALLQLPVLQEIKRAPGNVEPIPVAQIEALARYMQDKKPFLDPELSMGDLADALSLPRHQLSRIINQGFGKNFFDFVNTFRIQTFIEMRIADASQQKNTLELAYACGFNSKSAFNRAFLKETGKNPRDYFAT
ncbi:MAG: AraC family transcriptional regulator [Saprospiraceae bacterium]|nr:AraC family transcriptional regulator [Saprospiraceae bacterium]